MRDISFFSVKFAVHGSACRLAVDVLSRKKYEKVQNLFSHNCKDCHVAK